ncbi:hypothetical protein ACQJBY_005276 [Aegilops geniculata]
MATTAAAYGCSAAPALPFPGSPFARRSPPSRVHLASSNSKPPSSLRASYRRRRLYVCACSGEVGPDASAASPARYITASMYQPGVKSSQEAAVDNTLQATALNDSR